MDGRVWCTPLREERIRSCKAFGAGGSIGSPDPDVQVRFRYVMNQIQAGITSGPCAMRMVDALYGIAVTGLLRRRREDSDRPDSGSPRGHGHSAAGFSCQPDGKRRENPDGAPDPP
jgi:hypothetical protein